MTLQHAGLRPGSFIRRYRRVRGMGGLAEHLARLSINTVADLRGADAKMLRQHFSVNQERTVMELRGVGCLVLRKQHRPGNRSSHTVRSGGRSTSWMNFRSSV